MNETRLEVGDSSLEHFFLAYVPGSLCSLNLSRKARFKNFPVAVNGKLSTNA
jgi:hypothetical protein